MFLCERKLLICNQVKKRDLCIKDDDLQDLKPSSITQSQSRILAEKMNLRGMIFLLLMVETFASFAMDELRQVFFFKLTISTKYLIQGYLQFISKQVGGGWEETREQVAVYFIVCFSQDDGSGQGGLYQKNHPLAAEWPGFGQSKLPDSQLRSGLGAELSSDKEVYFL